MRKSQPNEIPKRTARQSQLIYEVKQLEKDFQEKIKIEESSQDVQMNFEAKEQDKIMKQCPMEQQSQFKDPLKKETYQKQQDEGSDKSIGKRKIIQKQDIEYFKAKKQDLLKRRRN